MAEFQQLCEVQSDKASVEITSQYEGTVTRLLYSEGDLVQVSLNLLCAFSALFTQEYHCCIGDAPNLARSAPTDRYQIAFTAPVHAGWGCPT